jgi:hypothetical protein
MIVFLVAAALVVGSPLIAAVLVTIASRREDSAGSLTGRPHGPVEATARRLLSYRLGPGHRRSRTAKYRPRPAAEHERVGQTLTMPRS